MRKIAILLMLLATAPALADDRDAAANSMGGLHLAIEICHLKLAHDAVDAYAKTLHGPDDYNFPVAVFNANNSLAKQSATWDTSQTAQFCMSSLTLARQLDLIK